jgi:hypothetical protein
VDSLENDPVLGTATTNPPNMGAYGPVQNLLPFPGTLGVSGSKIVVSYPAGVGITPSTIPWPVSSVSITYTIGSFVSTALGQRVILSLQQLLPGYNLFSVRAYENGTAGSAMLVCGDFHKTFNIQSGVISVPEAYWSETCTYTDSAGNHDLPVHMATTASTSGVVSGDLRTQCIKWAERSSDGIKIDPYCACRYQDILECMAYKSGNFSIPSQAVTSFNPHSKLCGLPACCRFDPTSSFGFFSACDEANAVGSHTGELYHCMLGWTSWVGYIWEPWFAVYGVVCTALSAKYEGFTISNSWLILAPVSVLWDCLKHIGHGGSVFTKILHFFTRMLMILVMGALFVGYIFLMVMLSPVVWTVGMTVIGLISKLIPVGTNLIRKGISGAGNEIDKGVSDIGGDINGTSGPVADIMGLARRKGVRVTPQELEAAEMA